MDILDFMPLTTANYSGGIIVTDWYSENNTENESIKISIRFLSNEVRSDALNVNIFVKKSTNIFVKKLKMLYRVILHLQLLIMFLFLAKDLTLISMLQLNIELTLSK